MEDDRPQIRVADDSVTSRTARRRSSALPWLLGGGVLIVVVGMGLAALLSGDKGPQADAAKTLPPVVADAMPSPEVVETVPQDTTVADDGKTLWTSPTDGAPLELHYLLPGTQLVAHVRVADLLAHPEGEKVLAALGPWGRRAIGQLTASTGYELSEIETLLLGIRPSRRGDLLFAVRIELRPSVAAREPATGCFAPDQSVEGMVVWCSPTAMAELKEQGGEPPLFARELQRVLQCTDAARTATLAFAGKFLQISGEKFLQGSSAPLREALVDFLGDEATATALSAHWDDDFFLELQSTVALNEQPHRLAALLEDRITQSSDRVEDVLLAEPVHPHGRRVLARFPSMLRKLGNYTRSAEVDRLSVVRAYLPVTAGHNLAMATELLLNVRSGVDSDPHVAVVANRTAGSVAERMQRTTSLVFPKETLQRALEMISEDVGVAIEIAGRDLQLEGITKNQSFAIELRNRPAAEILLTVLQRANPDRTATGPADVKQKLVYVVRDAEDGEPGAIVVTTRSAVARRGDKLPAVFEPTGR